MKILVIASFSDSLLLFRRELLASMSHKGCAVHIAAPGLVQGCALVKHLQDLGYFVHNIPMQRAGTNPWADLKALLAKYRLMRSIQPDLVLSYTIKPVIFGTIAAWLAGVASRYALITGLGYAFTGSATGFRGLVGAVVRRLYRVALRHADKVFFQNPDDEALFRRVGLLDPGTPSVVVNGSGINLASFKVVPLPSGPPHFLLIARFLGDKGVREYAQAARRVKALHPHVEFSLVGWIDQTPDAIKQAELDTWVQEGYLNYLGRLHDVRPAIANASVYILPSYREGTPRTVLEAMAMGRAIITTDAPGCRETVVDGDNGFLVPVGCTDGLVRAMQCFINDPALVSRMGQRSRQISEDKFDVHKVNEVMLREMGL